MSKRQSNRKRAATVCSRATGMGYNLCLTSAAEGLVSLRRPVPDAATAEQRCFEARVAHTLADALRDRQLDSAVLGLRGVRLEGERITLCLHPVMARRMLADLLPVFDADYGGLRGVAGLRVRRRAGDWFLADAGSSARLRLEGLDVRGGPVLPAVGEGLSPVWRDEPDRLSRAESDELADWNTDGGLHWTPGARDLLFSRVLRRPLLINRAGSSHGWVNTYTHHHHDIVLEWCCGMPAGELAAALRGSGIETGTESIDFRPAFAREPHEERIDLGDASVVLRCLNPSWCRDGDAADRDRIAATNLRRYL
ncbi:hypothetical protein GCM10010275_00240 [Streptomyces litmocidini]|nr:hypothetical protein GCM10010275_00240 [Streptomyces litmocidini]